MDKEFKDTIIEIKEEILKTQTLVIIDANKCESKFIEELEMKLKIDYPNFKGFSARNLQRMKRFYLEYENDEILPPAVAKLPWTFGIWNKL